MSPELLAPFFSSSEEIDLSPGVSPGSTYVIRYRTRGTYMNTQYREPLWTTQYVLVLIANLASHLLHFILLVSIPLYLREMGAGNAVAGLSTGLYSLAALALRPVIGNLLDHRGRLRLIRIGLIPLVLGVVLSNFTDDVTLQLIFRVIEGIGFSIISTTGATIISDLSPSSRMAEGIGYNGMVITLTNSIGPLVGLTIIGLYGFSTLFMLLVPFSIIPVVLTFFLKETGTHITPGKTKFDWKHLITIEKGAVPASLMMVLAAVSYGAIVTFLAVLGIERELGNLRLFFLIFPLAVILTRLVTGRLVDRYGIFPVVLPSLALTVIALLVIYQAHTITAFAIAGALYGFGYGSLIPAFTALAIKSSPPERRGAANATFYISMDLGIGGGAMILGTVAAWAGTASIFLLSAVFACLSLILLIIFSRKIQKRNPNVPF